MTLKDIRSSDPASLVNTNDGIATPYLYDDLRNDNSYNSRKRI